MDADSRLRAFVQGQATIETARSLFFSPVNLYEIGQKVRLGRWPIMAPFADGLAEHVLEAGLTIAPVTAGIAAMAGSMDWAHRDPFDRIIAATALSLDAPLISADAAFDNFPGLHRIW